MTRNLLLVIVISFIATIPSQSQSNHFRRGFLESTEDGDCSGTASIPAGVVKVVLETEEAKDSSADPKANPSSLFRAWKIQLGSGSESGLLVCGLGHMTGADNEWYWVVASPYSPPRVVLWTGGLSFGLLHTVHHGYRDIGSSWNSAAYALDKTFHYNGTKYVMATQRCFDLSGGHWKLKRVKCSTG